MSRPATDDEKITTGVVARIVDVSPDRIRQLEKAGLLHAQRTSTGIRLFDRAAVERFRDARAQRATRREAAGR